MHHSLDSTRRFSSRVENYVRFRPHYPPAIIECLRRRCELTNKSVVADIGSGTGLLAKLFLNDGNTVYGVEPNREMRQAGEHLLGNYSLFKSLDAMAEKTTLPSNSIDFVVAGQAFHWFDPLKTKIEFKRILRLNGWVSLMWNERYEEGSPFARDYEHLLRTFATDYEAVNHKQAANEKSIAQFFGGLYGHESFPTIQSFDFEGLKGRLLSSSYAPEADHPQHAPLLQELRRLFDTYQEKERINFEYTTQIYFGHLI